MNRCKQIRRINFWWLALSALLVAGCGGSNSGVRVPGLNAGAPPDASTKGAWGDVIDWPLIPIHVTLLPDGRVFSFGTDDGSPMGQAVPTGKIRFDLWNPADGVHQTLDNRTAVDTFCAAQLVLPVRAGQAGAGVAVIGGDTFPRPLEPNPSDPNVPETFDDGNEFTTVLDYSLPEPELSKSPNAMAAGRWYATATTLLNGEIYVQGGNSRTRVSGEMFPEVRDTTGVYRALALDTSGLRYYYPRNFVAPDGRLFGFDTRGRMYYVDASGAGTLTRVGDIPEAFTGDDSTAALFRPGRILSFAGDSSGAIIIDITAGDPAITETSSLSTQRRLATATLLPTGEVLATGGSPVYNTLAGVNYTAEIWNPVSGNWTLGAEGAIPRLYHSTALLLSDGSVLVAGGGAPGPAENLNGEIYYPPYLFNANGSLASRPSISAAPDDLVVGRAFQLSYPRNVGGTPARVVLVKTGAETHGFNMEQRFVELPFAAGNCGSLPCLDVRMPSRAADVPPGYYLMFMLNTAGVPSKGKFVFINTAAAADPTQDPSLVTPGNQSGAAGTAVAFNLVGSDPNGQALSYAAAGLPPGVSVSVTTGRISGTPTAAGSYDTVVSASDGARTANANFVWTVN